ncbi:hypothetical protein EVAR_31723_1 [Eumeta japonica]|uniref:Uncharacterized protein n=1 Tax=Eumeta variegata TaxID=151549 RepID=A0A4C1YLI5_EUMVA|nr:hypothetical protein EVAR_31723_1 [Eumeta japonica]
MERWLKGGKRVATSSNDAECLKAVRPEKTAITDPKDDATTSSSTVSKTKKKETYIHSTIPAYALIITAKLEAARASRAGLSGSEAVATDQPRSYASALRLPGRERAAVRKPESGPVLAIYPIAEQLENIKTAENTKQLLKSAIDPASMQVQVTKVRKVGRAGVVIQTTSAESADKIRKAVPPTLRVRNRVVESHSWHCGTCWATRPMRTF